MGVNFMDLSLHLILVEIEGGVNLGLICRLADNFEVTTIRLVNPQLSDEDYDLADIFASRAAHRLEKLEFYNRLEDAIKDVDITFGTSGIVSDSYPWRFAINLKDFTKIIRAFEFNSLGLVFGRESIGLNIEELEKLDFIVRIPTSLKYPSLNLATSVAILLSWIFSLKSYKIKRKVNPKHLRLISSYSYDVAKKVLKKDSLAKNVSYTLKKAVALSGLSNNDIKVLMTMWRRLYSKSNAKYKD